MKTLTLAAAIAAVVAANAALAAEPALYQIQFNATWTADSHPLDHPSNAHFSGIVGATNDGSYRIFSDGGSATPGLEALSERGAHSPLTSEVDAAIAAGTAGALFESKPLFTFPGTLTATFTADEAHPYVSAAAMVAPSPDWFTGISNVPLMKDGRWIDQASYTLFVWDAGTDSGTSHNADDEDTMPRQSARLNAAPQFKDENGLKPVGTVTIKRLSKTASN